MKYTVQTFAFIYFSCLILSLAFVAAAIIASPGQETSITIVNR